jgi:hypothetical protein
VSSADVAQHSRPLWVASLASPVAALAGCFLVLCGMELATGKRLAALEALDFLEVIATFGLPIALVAMFFMGLPLVMLMRSQRMLTAENVCAAATVIAVVATFGFLTLIGAWPDPDVLIWVPVMGALAGAVFCLVAGIRFRSPKP